METADPGDPFGLESPRGVRAGRYELFSEIGSGGMATVHVGRLLSAAGFARTVAVKRPLPALTRDADFRRLAWNEARLGSRVYHANVVTTLDVIEHGSELLVVMDYVHGESLAKLMALACERQQRIPLAITRALILGVLRGLDAVHQARDEKGERLGLIHRDVSPQNVLCGVDGIVRLGDFGLAKAASDASSVRPGEFKGKLTYASPEQLGSRFVTAKTDLFSAGLILWELLVGRRVHEGLSPNGIAARLLRGAIPPPSVCAPDIPPALDAVVAQATEREAAQRFEFPGAMIAAIESTGPAASTDEVAAWVRDLAQENLARLERLVMEAETQTTPSRRSLELHEIGPSSPAPAKQRSALALKVSGVGIGAVLAFAVAHLALDPPADAAPKSASATMVEVRRASPSLPLNLPLSRPPESQAALTTSVRETEPVSARVPRRETRPSAALDCSPPFTLDAQGIRRMKPGCK